MKRNICESHNYTLRRVFTIFDYCIHNRRYIEDIWVQKCVLALIFANAFKVANFAKVRLVNIPTIQYHTT